ncbi:MAG: tRNA lysidine(34) synthetase TilS [Thermoanaerobaculia bacterium]|nr:tRNA lysidine(34) synthetase TilS [Thermoanaerobaculia bacterium]
MIVEKVRRFVELHHVAPCGVIAACSGGADSTALLLAFSELRHDGFRIGCAHVNHHLRGAESDGDEAFVRSLCVPLDIPFVALDGTLDAEAIRQSGVEGAARDIRHRLLARARDQQGAELIATAHQLNDQAETVVMRIMTGSGIGGLRAIHAVRDDGVIRPLLEVTRRDIESFLAERRVEPRRDRMNDDPRFLRTRVRSALRQLDDDTIARIASVAGEAQSLWPMLERLVSEAGTIEEGENETRFAGWPEDPWMQHALLLREIRRLDPSSRDVSAHDLDRLIASRDSIRRVSVTQSLEFLRRGDRLVLRRKPDTSRKFEVELPLDATVAIPEIGSAIRVTLCRYSDRPLVSRGETSTQTQLFQLPGDATPRFLVRNRRPGDRFQPLGMAQDKKLKDFLIDRRIGAEVRDSIPILLWNGEIVWVAGVEVSERFKVTASDGLRFEVTLEHGFEKREAVDRR